MFIHNFKYTYLTLVKDKMLIFWTYAFPILLGTLFYMAFADIEKNEQLDIIDIAIVDQIDQGRLDESQMIYEAIFDKTFEILGDQNNEEQLFHIQYTSLEEAKELLADDKIAGYVIKEEKPKIVVKQSGINETILKQVCDEINEAVQIIGTLVTLRLQTKSGEDMSYEEIYQEAFSLHQDEMMSKLNVKDTSKNHLSYTMIEFYTLIAMACLYGGMLGMVAVNRNLANMSSQGKRVEISPVSRKSMIAGSVLASYLVQLVGILLLFIYTIFILKVDYGRNLPLVILLALVGSFAGLSLGIAVASVIRSNDNMKTGIIISITMLGCFLAGMMGITMKYIVDKNVPIMNQLNPANMITDGFYSLYYYDTYTRYYTNIASLCVFAILMIGISVIFLRRQYDSI